MPAGPQAPAVSVQMLGGFLLLVDRTPVDLAPVTQRLVALLVLRGRSGRSRLAGTLWPDAPEAKALACLRTGIWRLNRVARGIIVSSATAVELSSQVEIDVRRYISTASDRMRSNSPTPATDVHSIGYEGDLLPDWDEPWLLTDRERLRQMRLHLLEEQAQRQASDGHFGLALEAAYSVLAVDPLRESAHRLIIGVHLAEGNAAEAHRAFRACRSVLATDLGVEPSDVTVRMMRSIPQARGNVSAPASRRGQRRAMTRYAPAPVPESVPVRS